MQCTAKAKQTGQRCKLPAINKTTKCRFHGGATPRGMASPHTIHGRYSKDLPTRLQVAYEALQHDPVRLSIRDEIALIDALINDTLTRLETDKDAAKQIRAQLEQRRRLVETEIKLTLLSEKVITAEQLTLLVGGIVSVINGVVQDREQRAAIAAGIERLISV